MAFPFVSTKLIPPYTPCIPMVATMEFKRSWVMIRPLMQPKISPRARPSSTESHGFHPLFTIMMPERMPHREAIFPTDKSSSPMRRSSDWAMPIMPIKARSRISACRL